MRKRVHTADADPTKQLRRVGVGGVKWVLGEGALLDGRTMHARAICRARTVGPSGERWCCVVVIGKHAASAGPGA